MGSLTQWRIIRRQWRAIQAVAGMDIGAIVGNSSLEPLLQQACPLGDEPNPGPELASGRSIYECRHSIKIILALMPDGQHGNGFAIFDFVECNESCLPELDHQFA